MLDRRNMLGRERRRQGISKANALEAIAMTPPRSQANKRHLSKQAQNKREGA